MPESFTGSGDFADYLQQFNTAAFLSGWYSTTHDNRPQYFALRLRQNALHFFTTLSVAQQTDFTLLVDALRQNYTTNVDILKARLKAARQQPNQDIASFLCHVRTLARRAYRAFPQLYEQIVLTRFIEGLSDSTLRWELRKSKPATADEALNMAIELNSFLELEKGARSTSTVAPESAVNQVSRTSSEIQTNDLMDTFVRTLTEKLNKALPHRGYTQDSNTYKTQNSRSSSVESNGKKSVRFQTSNTWHTKNQHNKQHRGRSTQPRKTTKNNSNRELCKHCKRNNHDSRDCKACFKCGRVGHFRNECRSNMNNKLKSSTLTGRSPDNETSSDPQPQLLNVVDHRSIFFKIQVFDRIIEAVCDSGASVSCLSSAIFDSLQTKTPLKLSPSTTQLKAANQLPIETRGTVNLPVQIAKKVFDQTFHVLVKSESDCLIGLDFLEDHKCDPMFSKKKLLICDTASVPLYHKKFEIPYNKVFRVVSQDPF